jgi:hypothetical protein
MFELNQTLMHGYWFAYKSQILHKQHLSDIWVNLFAESVLLVTFHCQNNSYNTTIVKFFKKFSVDIAYLFEKIISHV